MYGAACRDHTYESLEYKQSDASVFFVMSCTKLILNTLSHVCVASIGNISL